LKNKILLTALAAFILILPHQATTVLSGKDQYDIPTEEIKNLLSNSIKNKANQNGLNNPSNPSMAWPLTMNHKGSDYKIRYSFNEELTEYIQSRIKDYRPDFVSVVVINNNTGAVLSAIDYDRSRAQFGHTLTFSSTHPAASIFKIITSAELLEKAKIEITTPFQYTGRTTTLYKRQLDLNGKTPKRWTREQTLKEAFARSNNVVFGKAAIEKLLFKGIYDMAQKFGFDEQLITELDMDKSVLNTDEKEKNDLNFVLAEVASGFNKNTLISPIHGALLASVMANGGQLRYPHVIEEITHEKSQKIAWMPPTNSKKVLERQTTDKIRLMMEDTITKGTARSSFRKANHQLLEKLNVGGKTGTLTGGVPYGKRDWFVSYAYPKDDPNDKGISICVMIINVKKWYTKSAVIARDVMTHYYRDILLPPRQLAKKNSGRENRRI
jgi:cell division protein FtsI/penicillin-binding protein 2